MMNNANEISAQTKLFGYIGEHAGASSFSAMTNKLFKAEGDDAMMIPMNIRHDDLYFTISNMRDSQLSGAVIASEYSDQVLEILDTSSNLVKQTGICDLVLKEGKTLRGELFGLRVLTEMLKDLRVQKIALLGINGYAKAFSYLSCGFEVAYFHDNLEELLAFSESVEIQNADINRIAVGMEVDLLAYDAVLDFSEIEDLCMIKTLGRYNFDMKNEKQFSALRKRATELQSSYTSYDAMLEKMTNSVYKMIK